MQKNNLKQFRLSKRLTQKDVSKSIGMKITSYQRIECGTRRPSLDTAFKIAETLGTTVDKLFKNI